MPKDPAHSEKKFHTTLHTQKELVLLIADEANTKTKLVQIQFSITLHMEILQKELAYAENVLKKDPNLSRLDGLVHLVPETAIQIKSLEVALQNWDVALRTIMEVKKTSEKYLIRV